MTAPPSPIYRDPAELRCRRTALGLHDDDFADLADVEQRAIARWETGRPVPVAIVDLLSPVAASAASEVLRLADIADRHGTITVFDSDTATTTATSGTLRYSSVHRVCAGRVAALFPNAEVLRRTADGTEVPAKLLCASAALGLGLKQLPKLLDVSARTVQRWNHGERPTPNDITDVISDLATRAREHTEALTTVGDSGAVIEVSPTVEHLQRTWPAAQMPLPTHHVCAAHAAAASGAQLRFAQD